MLVSNLGYFEKKTERHQISIVFLFSSIYIKKYCQKIIVQRLDNNSLAKLLLLQWVRLIIIVPALLI